MDFTFFKCDDVHQIEWYQLTINNTTTVCIAMGGMVDGATSKSNRLIHTEIPPISTIQDTISIGWTRADGKHEVSQPCSIAVDIIETRSLGKIQFTKFYCNMPPWFFFLWIFAGLKSHSNQYQKKNRRTFWMEQFKSMKNSQKRNSKVTRGGENARFNLKWCKNYAIEIG